MTYRCPVCDGEFDEADTLRAAIRESYEAWAGSELPSNPQAETAPEAYAYQVIEWMLEPLRKALKEEK